MFIDGAGQEKQGKGFGSPSGKAFQKKKQNKTEDLGRGAASRGRRNSVPHPLPLPPFFSTPTPSPFLPYVPLPPSSAPLPF